MLRPIAFAVAVVLSLLAPVGAPAEEPRTYPLWPEGALDAVCSDAGDDNLPGDAPTITVHLPPEDKATGASIVICPGGGYGFLATEHEGKEVAEWLNSLGVAGVILKYRIAPRYKHPAPLDDARRAIRMVRWKSKEWGLDPDRVGVIGFSAGGHLASTLATHFREANPLPGDAINGFTERPDLAILVYPVVSFTASYSHKGSARNLLGPDATQEQLAGLSNETQVTEKTPPTFLAHTLADKGVPAENSMAFAMALREHGVPFELHVFEKGPHGLGLGKGSKPLNVAPEPSFEAWPPLCATWLKSRGFLEKR
jgi:acetyl esterase/lipase